IAASLLLLGLAVAAAEAVDLPVVIELAHRAGPERVAVRRDVEVDHGHLLAVDLAHVRGLHRRPADPLVAGRRVDEHHLAILGVDAFLHASAPYQLDFRTPGSWPLSARSRSAMREIANFW